MNIQLTLAILLSAMAIHLSASEAPAVGNNAPDFTLSTLDDKSVELSALEKSNYVVLVVLRGWPGYQCPVCTSQVQDYIAHTKQFEAAHVQVVMIYPGPAKELKKHAHEFLTNKQWPKGFLFVTDPDYTMVNAYNLRWNAAAETAYPSTFIIDKTGIVRFAKISRSHGGRTKATETLDFLQRLQAERR